MHYKIKQIFMSAIVIFMAVNAYAVNQDEPSWTAESVLALRAIAAMDPDAKIRNPDYLAIKLVKPEFWYYTGYSKDFSISKKFIEAFQIGTYYYVNARTKHIDKTLSDLALMGLKQVVNLGAGYDSRAYRFHEQLKGVQFFELDLPETIAEKKKRLLPFIDSMPGNVKMIPIDFNTQTIKDVLIKAGYSSSKKTLFIWEGVTYYISQEAVEGTLEFVASNSVPGSSVVFDYIPLAVVSGDYSKYTDARGGAIRVAVAGEPWIFGIQDGKAKAFVEKFGLGAVSDLGAKELTENYLMRSNGKPDGGITSYFRIMHAEVLR